MKNFLLCLCLLCGLTTTELAAQATAAVTEVPAASAPAPATLKVKVKGVGCSMDLKTLAERVEALDGVTTCTPVKRGAVTTFEVAHDPAVASADKIHATIENTAGCTAPESRPYKVKL